MTKPDRQKKKSTAIEAEAKTSPWPASCVKWWIAIASAESPRRPSSRM